MKGEEGGGAVRESGVGVEVRGARKGIVMVEVEGARVIGMEGEGKGAGVGKSGEVGVGSVIKAEVIVVDGKSGRLLVGCMNEETAWSYHSSTSSSIEAESSIGLLLLKIRSCSSLVFRAQSSWF